MYVLPWALLFPVLQLALCLFRGRHSFFKPSPFNVRKLLREISDYQKQHFHEKNFLDDNKDDKAISQP